MVTAMKITISDQPQPIDQLRRAEIGHFLTTLKDPDLNLRRVALVALNSAAHNKPSLIRVLLRDVLPQLYNETQKRRWRCGPLSMRLTMVSNACIHCLTLVWIGWKYSSS